MRQYNIYTRVIQKCKVIMCNSYSIRNKCYFVYSLELFDRQGAWILKGIQARIVNTEEHSHLSENA